LSTSTMSPVVMPLEVVRTGRTLGGDPDGSSIVRDRD
jgi:hypothetical protein